MTATDPLLDEKLSRPYRGILGRIIAKTIQDPEFTFSVPELMAIESASHDTIRKALKAFEASGYIDRYHHGEGKTLHRFRYPLPEGQ